MRDAVDDAGCAVVRSACNNSFIFDFTRYTDLLKKCAPSCLSASELQAVIPPWVLAVRVRKIFYVS